MSLKTICEVIVYFEAFKNIDLAEQGVYTIRARMESDDGYALPHRDFQTKQQLRSKKKNKIREQTDLHDNEYRTKAFMIKYNDQEIDLEQVVLFRLELETFPNISTSNIYLCLDLYYAVDYNFGFERVQDKRLQFQRVDTVKLKLHGVERGINCFLNASFSDSFKSTVKIYVFSIMMDTKFRTWKSKQKEKGMSALQRERIVSTKEYFDYYLKRTGQKESGFYKKYVKSLREYSEQAKQHLNRVLIPALQHNYKLPKYCLDEHETSLDLVEVQPKTYMQYVNVYKTQSYNSESFMKQVQQISTGNLLFLQQFLRHLALCDLDRAALKRKYDEFCRERFGEFIFQSQVTQDDLSSNKYSMKEKVALARKIRKKKHYFENLQPYEVQEDQTILAEHPIMSHEVTQLNQERKREFQVRNLLFVMCHGFQGTSDDMVTIKNSLKIHYPLASFLLARSNEGLTDGDIKTMGERLARQIQDHIEDQNIGSGLVIHMIGHSLGGIILRTSLKHLLKYRGNLGTFLSFSSPHLSYLNGTSASIQTGLWVIKKWKKIQSFQQMTMTDSKDMEKTFMFKLSKQGHLADFHRVVLVGSPQDSYVPWHSARIHRSSDWQGESITLQNTMSHNILDSKNIHKVHRINVDFHISERNLDSMIGRTAHIRFLADQTVLSMILTCAGEIFQ